MEYLRENIGNQLSSNDESEEMICPYCGQSCKTVFVHGHEQCICCNTNIEPCCEGGEICFDSSMKWGFEHPIDCVTLPPFQNR